MSKDRQSLARVPSQATVPRPAGRRWTAWLLRLLFTVHAVMVIAQPVLIGRYLDGDFDQLGTHGTNGSVLPGIVLLCIGGALCHWLVGRGRFWPVPATVLLLPIEGMQIGAGYEHNLAVHIPLGTGILALAVFLAAWSWTPRIHQTRPGRAPLADRAADAVVADSVAADGMASEGMAAAPDPAQRVPGRSA
jgi:hypothetical protein